MKDDTSGLFFFIELLAVFIAAGGYFYFMLACKSVALKRKFHPYLILSIFTLAALPIIGLPGSNSIATIITMALIMIPVWLACGFMLIKSTDYCDSCGSTLVNYLWFRKLKECRFCKSKITV